MNTLLTRADLTIQLRSAGIAEGDCLLVHTKLSALGFVPGAAQTIVEALLEVVGSTGTIMMPTYSGEHSDPADWRHPPVPPEWVDPIRASTPTYDARLTPTRRMGTVPEYFRTYPGTIRSSHPQSSFSANGAKAKALVATHSLPFRFGPDSPLGALVQLKGKSLLLGAPTNTNSLLYLALYRIQAPTPVVKRSPIQVDGVRTWCSYDDIEISNTWFEPFTTYLVSTGVATRFTAGQATCHLFPAAETIEKAVAWLTR